MKRTKKSTGKLNPGQSQEKIGEASHPGSIRKAKFFRVIALLLVPVLLLGCLEGALRLSGYGYPTSFFVGLTVNGERLLVENQRFGWRFFPKALARSPSPVRMTAEKPPGVYRIFLFGESAALGDPKPGFGMGRYLEVLLRERFPGTDFEVVCVAMTAINSHAILPIARECARYHGDLWITYMGNNEMEGPFGANTIFGPRAPNLNLIRVSLAARETRIGQWVQSVAESIQGNRTHEPSWEGMKMFMQQQLPPNDPRKQTVYAHFRRNLEDIAQAGLRAGAHPLLCTVASNLKDCPPFASLHSIGLQPGAAKEFDGLLSEGRDRAAQKDWANALDILNRAIRIDPNFAEAQFRAGDSAFYLTNHAQAAASYVRARDSDALPFRTDSPLNLITKEVASRFSKQGVRLVDMEERLNQQTPEGTGAMFFDHVHFTFEGNYTMARFLAQEVANALPPALAEKSAADWTSMDVCNARLGLTDWNRSPAYEDILRRVTDAPFTNQLNYIERAKGLAAQIREMRVRMQPSAISEARAIYEQALTRTARDFRLHENFAEFLEAVGSLGEAIKQWEHVAELLPTHYAAYYQLGRLLNRQGKYMEAADSLRRALALRPELLEARIQLSEAFLKQGKVTEAMKELDDPNHQYPNDARIHLQRGKAFLAEKMPSQAKESFHEAIRLSPNYWEAHYLLGVELASGGEFRQAQKEFEAVVRLQPDYPSAYFNLGVALAKQGNIEGAILSFRETLRLNPNHRQAEEYLRALEIKKSRP